MDVENDHVSSEEVVTPSDFRGIWNHKAIVLLIEEYNRYKHIFTDPRATKRHIWMRIRQNFTNKGYYFSAEEIASKWRNMKKTYLKCLHRSEEQVIKWRYFTEFHQIYTNSPSTNENEKEHVEQDESVICEEIANSAEVQIELDETDLNQLLMLGEYSDHNNLSKTSNNVTVTKHYTSPQKTKRPNIKEPVNKPKVTKIKSGHGKIVFNILHSKDSDSDSSLDEHEGNPAPKWFKRFVKGHRKAEEKKLQVFKAMHDETLQVEREKLTVLKSLLDKLSKN